MKEYKIGEQLNREILEGVNQLADAVCSTLGPKGRTVILKEKDKRPIVTKDGVTVSKFFKLEHSFQNVAAEIIRQSAESTVSMAGDGTTTSTAIARAIIVEAQRFLEKGVAPDVLRKGIEKATKNVVENLKELSIPVSDINMIEQVATISANGDKGIGKLIAVAVDKVGKDGSITIQEGRKNETELEICEGFRFDSGFNARDFVTDERRGIMRYEDAFILVTDRRISQIDEFMPILTQVAKEGRPFIVVAEDVDGQALAALLLNKMSGRMKVGAIKAPRYGEERRDILSDLAKTTGAVFVSRQSGKRIQDVQLSDLGTLNVIESTKFATTIVSESGDSEEIDNTIDGLKEQLTQTNDMKECARIQERITRLSSGIAIIKVGGLTEVEMIEKKHRIEDALEAVKSASQEGIVPGGGIALLMAISSHDTKSPGEQVLYTALLAPFLTMFANAGLDGPGYYNKWVSERVKSDIQYRGFDLSKSPLIECNMVERGIIDPAKVTRCALENAVSAAVTLLSSNVAIVEK